MPVTGNVSRSQTVKVGKREIFVTEQGRGPALVMLHGGGPGASGLSNFSRNIDSLSRSFRVIVPDMPGYGRSTVDLDKSDTFGDLAGAVRAVMDRMGVAKASFAGNSLGGAAALRLAMDAPERVDRLVLMGPGGIGTTRSLPTRGLNALLDYYKGDGPSREKIERFIRTYLVADGATVDDALIDARYRDSIRPEVVAKAIGAKLTGDAEIARSRSTLIRAPGLAALWGERRPAWMSWIVNSDVRGILVAIDGRDTWLVPPKICGLLPKIGPCITRQTYLHQATLRLTISWISSRTSSMSWTSPSATCSRPFLTARMSAPSPARYSLRALTMTQLRDLSQVSAICSIAARTSSGKRMAIGSERLGFGITLLHL